MNRIAAAFIRGGTSKGLFFHRQHLPLNPASRDALLARIMGSPDPFLQQIDGMGAGSSSTSKISIISPPSMPGRHLDYLFGQVDIRSGKIDYNGSCGNMIAGAALFGVLNGMGPKQVTQGYLEMRIWQLNTSKDITVKVPCNDKGEYQPTLQPFKLQGVAFEQPKLKVRYHEPGKPPNSSIFSRDQIVSTVEHNGKKYQASLVHVSNPTIFMKAEDVGLTGCQNSLSVEHLELLQQLRSKWAVIMGLGASPNEVKELSPSVPKIAFVSKPQSYTASDGTLISSADINLCARIISMRKLHHGFTATGLMALAACSQVPGSIVHQVQFQHKQDETVVGHRGGESRVMGKIKEERGVWRCEYTEMLSSARLLMDGYVRY